MRYKEPDEPSDELKSNILMLRTFTEEPKYVLYREGAPAIIRLHLTQQEAVNLSEELQRVVNGSSKVEERIVVPNLEKPKKITRPTR